MHMDGMDSIELRAKLGDRTYEAGVRLLEKDAIIERIELSGTAGYARVRDSGTKVVVYRDRNGVFDATCDCTVKPMGCKHCAAVYMDRIGFRPDASADAVRGHIAGALRKTCYSSWNDGFRDYAAKFVRNSVNIDGLRYFLSGSPEYFATFPAQTINYTESHDDRCWLDKITECPRFNAASPTARDRRRTHIMFAFLLSSLGTPMLAEGQDFLRTKHGKNNTYLDGAENALDYARLKKFAGTHEFVSRWIRFRLSSLGRLFRQRKNVSKGFFRFYPDQTNTAAVAVFNDDRAQGRLQYILTLNPRTTQTCVQIPEERFAGFRLIANTEKFDLEGVPAEEGFGFEGGMLLLPALSCSLWIRRE